MNLPTLYKKTSTGAIQTWRIDVEGSTIITTYGQQGGKLQVARDTITKGKNVGRSNETTPEQQAVLEARSQWEKKCKKGYVQEATDAASGVVDSSFIAGGITPMLAHSHKDHGHKIKYPAFVQPKLDGHRCIAVIQDGKASLWSRTRKPITGVPHIVAALEEAELKDIVLDGELYNHDYRDRFEELTSFIRQETPKDGHEVVQYHVYDMVSDLPFRERNVKTCYAATAADEKSVVFVQSKLVSNEQEAMEAFSEYLDAGYEGAMIRNSEAPYLQKRSYDLLKIKQMQDAEFEILGVGEGRGKMAGLAIFFCRTPGGKEFKAKMKGSLQSEMLKLENAAKCIGHLLTVQFQDYTADGVPRFPVGIRIREDI